MTLEEKYNKYLETKQIPRLTKEDVDQLNKLRQEHFHKNIDRNCRDCISAAFKEVGNKMWGVNEVKKQTFPIHAKPTKAEEPKSVVYGTLGNMTSNRYFANMVHYIKQNFKRLKLNIETAYHWNCNEGAYVNQLQLRGIKASGYDSKANAKAYTDKTNHKGITKTKPKTKKVDLLIFLKGSKKQLQEVLKVVECKYIHTHLELENEIKLRPILREGKIYDNSSKL